MSSKLKIRQLPTSFYRITGSFTGSFIGDGSQLTNLSSTSTTTGSFTGSFVGDGSQLTGIISQTSSYAFTASFIDGGTY